MCTRLCIHESLCQPVQCLSLSVGCNDGVNFPENFLLEIYDRIQAVSSLDS